METWKNIEGFEGFFQISNEGNLRGRANSSGHIDGEWHIKKVRKNSDGYLFVFLKHRDKKRTARIHRLVAEAFIPNPYNLETVNHVDGNKTNNRVDNLEWADRKRQMKHAYELGLKKPAKGPDNCNAKLSEANVRFIRSHYVRNSKEWGTVALSRMFNTTNRVIGLIVRGLSYKDVL